MMSDPRLCGALDERELIPRYVAGTLAETDIAELEEHLITCARCQREVEHAAAIARVSSRPLDPSRRPRAWQLPAIAAAMVVAAGTSLFVRGVHSVHESLGPPPAYGGVPVRGVGSVGDSMFVQAMTRYAARDYRGASQELRAALHAGGAPAPTAFFLGVSLLFDGDPNDARGAFDRVIAAGDTPYGPETYFYRALASLRLGDSAHARTDLEQAASSDAPIAARARSMLEHTWSGALP